MSRPAVILDRDGTLIDILRDEETGAIYTAFHPDQLRYVTHATDALMLLRDAGFVLAIATNQPGVAKGHFSRAALDRTHAALVEHFHAAGIEIAAIESCTHHPDANAHGESSLQTACDCRKPKPGLFTRLIDKLDLDPSRTWAIGDALSDVKAAQAAGVRPALVRPDNRCDSCPLTNVPGTVQVGSLLALCRHIATRGAGHAENG